jgi:hypothetical protein
MEYPTDSRQETAMLAGHISRVRRLVYLSQVGSGHGIGIFYGHAQTSRLVYFQFRLLLLA